MSLSSLTEAHRQDLDELARLAQRDLALAMASFAPQDALEGLLDLLPRLAELYGMAAATLAADWYDDLRDEAEMPGAFRAVPAELPDDGRYVSLARWGVVPLTLSTPDATAALTRVSGGLQRIVTNAARQTVAGSAVDDPAAQGWQRVGAGGCSFCLMLIARGAVYSERSADFASHDHCHCSAVPAFAGRARPVQPYTPSVGRVSDADRARVREYLRTH